MKKNLILIAAALLVSGISATAQRVILRISSNHEVSIDGNYYDYNETVPALSSGTHTVKLYEAKPGFLGIGKKRTLLSSSSFALRNNDVIIEEDQYGQLRINEAGNSNTSRRNSGDRSYEGTSQNRKNGKGYGPYNNPGRGNKYGLYKNKKNKSKNKKYDDDNQQ